MEHDGVSFSRKNLSSKTATEETAQVLARAFDGVIEDDRDGRDGEGRADENQRMVTREQECEAHQDGFVHEIETE